MSEDIDLTGIRAGLKAEPTPTPDPGDVPPIDWQKAITVGVVALVVFVQFYLTAWGGVTIQSPYWGIFRSALTGAWAVVMTHMAHKYSELLGKG